jgi:hypothetical protein
LTYRDLYYIYISAQWLGLYQNYDKWDVENTSLTLKWPLVPIFENKVEQSRSPFINGGETKQKSEYPQCLKRREHDNSRANEKTQKYSKI